MLEDVELADIHGQYKFNFQHAAISRDESKQCWTGAFARFRTEWSEPVPHLPDDFQGWKRYHDHPDPRVRRASRTSRQTAHHLRRCAVGDGEAAAEHERRRLGRIRELRREIEHEFGAATRLVVHVTGPLLLWMSKREERRLARGKTYEPPTFVDRKNWAV